MLFTNPITCQSEDLCHFSPLAKNVARLIRKLKDDQISVIGIEGEWGSGKTSFINLILEEMNEDKNLTILRFNPWTFSNPNELIKDFFNSIMNALIDNDKKNIAKVKAFGKYAYKLLKSSEVIISPELKLLGIFSLKFGELKALEGSIETLTNDIHKILLELKRKIIIIIDDIDRLDTLETNILFKLVKLTCDFSNFRFILAYDRNIVCQRLDTFKGEDYLQKIVHVTFPLPKYNTVHLLDIMQRYLKSTLKKFDLKYWEGDRWDKVLNSKFGTLFSNIRDVKFYVNNILLDLNVMEMVERNVIDFFAIEAVRVFAPEIYILIGSNINVFTEFPDLSNRLYVTNRMEQCEMIFQKISNNSKEAIREIIYQLFPQIELLYSNWDNKNLFIEEKSRWHDELRICSEEMFPRYFNLTIPFQPKKLSTKKEPKPELIPI